MAEYSNENRFVLFPNDRKKADSHPDMTGTINFDGKDHFLDAWIKWDGDQIGRISGKIGQVKNKQKSGSSGGSGNSGGTRQRKELGSDQRVSNKKPAYDPTNDDIDSIPF